MEYNGFTHIIPFNNGFIFWLWKKIFCKRKIHLWDEVYTNNGHYIVCDACNLMAHISFIDETYVDKKIKKEANNFMKQIKNGVIVNRHVLQKN